jgi:hypothetical protein
MSLGFGNARDHIFPKLHQIGVQTMKVIVAGEAWFTVVTTIVVAIIPHRESLLSDGANDSKSRVLPSAYADSG